MPNKQSAGADFGHKSSSILRGLRGAKVVARWGEDDGQPQGLTRVGVFLGRTSIPQQRAATRANPFQLRRVASQTKPLQECHPERSEGSLAGQRSFAALRMTKRDDLLFEMYWAACPKGLTGRVEVQNNILNIRVLGSSRTGIRVLL